MDHLRHYFSNHLAGALAVLFVVNVVLILIVLMGIGWQDAVDVSNRVYQGLTDPSRTATRTTSTPRPRSVVPVAGTINDPNIRLVCSDETFAAAVAKVRPAVVNISCESIRPASSANSALRFDDPASDLSTLGGIGSGIIVDSRGYILTCHHVVSNASDVYVTPFGPAARQYRARIVAVAEALNLALLKIDTGGELAVATLGDSAGSEVADVVLAVGSPFGLEQSVTHGIISDTSRDLLIGGKLYRQMMQTDVAINRGSSGGPLIDAKGLVIGINMAIYSPTGVYNGVSFALPIDRAKPFLARAVPQPRNDALAGL